MKAWPALLAAILCSGCSAGFPANGSDDPRGSLVNVGDDLAPHVGKRIQVTAEVSNTKWPSLGNYWLTILELEGHQGDRVRIWGIVTREEEGTPGGIAQGRDGTFYHLRNCGFEVLEDK